MKAKAVRTTKYELGIDDFNETIGDFLRDEFPAPADTVMRIEYVITTVGMDTYGRDPGYKKVTGVRVIFENK